MEKVTLLIKLKDKILGTGGASNWVWAMGALTGRRSERQESCVPHLKVTASLLAALSPGLLLLGSGNTLSCPFRHSPTLASSEHRAIMFSQCPAPTFVSSPFIKFSSNSPKFECTVFYWDPD